MRTVRADQINPRNVHPGDVLIDLKNRMYFIISVEVSEELVRISWFRNDKINYREYR